jgi:hypothetical protein
LSGSAIVGSSIRTQLHGVSSEKCNAFIFRDKRVSPVASKKQAARAVVLELYFHASIRFNGVMLN